MKVIKEGKFECKKTCKACKSVLIFEEGDIRYGLYSQDYEQEFAGQFYIICPVCSKQLVQKDLPDWIKQSAMRERAD